MSQPVKFEIDNVPFELQEQHDFSWLQAFGNVFCVFDQQDSGNLSFGIEKNGKKLFLKYAGCKPMEFTGNPKDAISSLSSAVALYKSLEHPNLIKIVDHFRTDNGYAAIFEWFEGECLHSHWSFAEAPKYTHPDSPFFKYKQLSVEKRLKSLDSIYSFHTFVESKGYVAVDFYDGSILYDFSNHVTRICDIDFYRKAPEEFELGAPIDARTNVFTMGAIAFGLLGAERDHSFSKWEAGKQLYEVALRAVSQEREQRYQTIYEFRNAWDSAKN